ncbi:MAG: peptide-methionine (S)-S-oxide reductase MsrA [Elusimicrobium sp.]|jgi:peptide methionine sulfoxide reductase msrA/msrB|nr:peptide-methionine (S)-S-oxide reductase MsrA [Elusimicrobium sp.]
MKRILFIALGFGLIFLVIFTHVQVKKLAAREEAKKKEFPKIMKVNFNYDSVYLAGGCFWGVEAFLDKIPGVKNTQVGYANGNTKNPTYEQVKYENTGHAEAVYVQYNPKEITLEQLIKIFFEIIDPASINKQGGDAGAQYRTGVYYTDEKDKERIQKVFDELAPNYKAPIVVELKPIDNFYPAENYHQKYLQKNPNGYCHIDLSKADKYKKTA